MNIQHMEQINSRLLGGFLLIVVFCAGCDQNGSGPRLTQAKYDQISIGMSKTEVENILGPPTKVETKQELVFGNESKWQPVITCRYEEGPTFIEITLKDNQVEKKDSNLGKGP